MTEQELNELLIAYSDKFGEPYLLNPEYQTDEEIADGVRHCLETGKPRNKGIDPDVIV